jgi:competence protein ComEC
MLSLLAIAFAVGIAAGDWCALGSGVSLGLALAASSAALVARVRGRLVGTAALVLACVLGALAQSGARPRAPPELVDGERWLIDGEVAAAPERAFGATRVPVDLAAVERDGARRRAAGERVRVVVAGDTAEPLLPGDRVRLASALRVPRGFIVPGAPDAERRAQADGIVAVGGVHDPPALVAWAAVPRPSLGRALMAWRGDMLREVAARLDGDRRALVASLVLGDRGDVSHRLDDEFRVAGVSHVLSVSGLHLAIAAFLFYVGLARALLRVPGLGRGWPVRRWAALAAIPAAGVYTLVTGAQVATVRSWLVAAVWLGGVALGRRATALGALAAAALCILAASPLELFDPSFQLSFAAALGMALLAPRLTPTWPGPDARSRPARVARWAVRLCTASAAAILVTAPISAWHFSQLSPAGVLSNLVVVPLAELVIVPVGLSGCVLAACRLPGGALARLAGGVLVRAAGACAGAMAAFVHWFASWAPSWRVATPSVAAIVAWYAALLALVLARPRWRRVAAVAALVVVASVGWRVARPMWSSSVTATFLDVGQGDACVVELPRGHAIVVDGGGSFDPGFDPGEQVIAPFLWRRGIRRIDVVILSHPHPDHANGLGFLVENFDVGEVWVGDRETRQPGTVRLMAAAARRHVPLGAPRPLGLGGARLVPLAPLDAAGHVAIDAARSENDNSLVVRVEYAGRALLFTGDVEAEGEAALVGAAREAVPFGSASAGVAPALSADVLKVPHHGSRTSSSDPLLAAVLPSVAIISVGDHNRWHFPHPSVLARYAAHHVRVLRTDQHGAIQVRIDASGHLDVEPSR